MLVNSKTWLRMRGTEHTPEIAPRQRISKQSYVGRDASSEMDGLPRPASGRSP